MRNDVIRSCVDGLMCLKRIRLGRQRVFFEIAYDFAELGAAESYNGEVFVNFAMPSAQRACDNVTLMSLVAHGEFLSSAQKMWRHPISSNWPMV